MSERATIVEEPSRDALRNADSLGQVLDMVGRWLIEDPEENAKYFRRDLPKCAEDWCDKLDNSHAEFLRFFLQEFSDDLWNNIAMEGGIVIADTDQIYLLKLVGSSLVDIGEHFDQGKYDEVYHECTSLLHEYLSHIEMMKGDTKLRKGNFGPIGSSSLSSSKEESAPEEPKELRRKLLEAFVEHGVLSHDQITLMHSGERGTDYFDLDNMSGSPEKQRLVIEGVLRMIESLESRGMEFDKLVFLHKDSGPIGMPVFASELSQRLEREFVLLKMWSKLRFEELRVKGAGINDGDSVLILDDVITSGNTQKRAIEFVRNQGGDVSGIACMLERIEGRLREVGENNGEDIKTETLFTLKDLEYAGLGLIRDENSYLSEDFIEEFDERYGMNEKKLENVDEIEEIVCRILNYHDVQADERAMRVLENLYFNVYLNLNPDEIYREEI